MTEAVIVSTARTGLAKSWRGALNMTHGATLGGHVVRAAVERAKVDPAEVEDAIIGCALPDPVVEALIVAYRKELGLTPRKISREEIVERALFALANEGAKIVDEGIALRASDVVLGYLSGYGFPARRGGPMHHADAVGLDHVVRAMRRFAANPHGDPAFWEPAPLLARLAAEGKSFT